MRPRAWRLRSAAFVLLLAPLVLSTSAQAGVETRSAAGERADDGATARWAHAEQRAYVRGRPAAEGRRITRLHRQTEDGFPEVYMVLRTQTAPDGRRWLKVRVPMRPYGKTGWVRQEAMGRLHTVSTRLVVDKDRLLATLYRSGKRIWRSRIGIGAPSTPTPSGRFWIRERIKVVKDGSIYGPWAFGTSAYSGLSDWPGGGVIGIHGTNQPWLIPGRPSHGCIRVANGPIKKLARRMPIGTPVRIR